MVHVEIISFSDRRVLDKHLQQLLAGEQVHPDGVSLFSAFVERAFPKIKNKDQQNLSKERQRDEQKETRKKLREEQLKKAANEDVDDDTAGAISESEDEDTDSIAVDAESDLSNSATVFVDLAVKIIVRLDLSLAAWDPSMRVHRAALTQRLHALLLASSSSSSSPAWLGLSTEEVLRYVLRALASSNASVREAMSPLTTQACQQASKLANTNAFIAFELAVLLKFQGHSNEAVIPLLHQAHTQLKSMPSAPKSSSSLADFRAQSRRFVVSCNTLNERLRARNADAACTPATIKALLCACTAVTNGHNAARVRAALHTTTKLGDVVYECIHEECYTPSRYDIDNAHIQFDALVTLCHRVFTENDDVFIATRHCIRQWLLKLCRNAREVASVNRATHVNDDDDDDELQKICSSHTQHHVTPFTCDDDDDGRNTLSARYAAFTSFLIDLRADEVVWSNDIALKSRLANVCASSTQLDEAAAILASRNNFTAIALLADAIAHNDEDEDCVSMREALVAVAHVVCRMQSEELHTHTTLTTRSIERVVNVVCEDEDRNVSRLILRVLCKCSSAAILVASLFMAIVHHTHTHTSSSSRTVALNALLGDWASSRFATCLLPAKVYTTLTKIDTTNALLNAASMLLCVNSHTHTQMPYFASTLQMNSSTFATLLRGIILHTLKKYTCACSCLLHSIQIDFNYMHTHHHHHHSNSNLMCASLFRVDGLLRILIECLSRDECHAFVEAAALCQLETPIDFTLAFQLLQKHPARNNVHLFKYIWEPSLVELLAYIYVKCNNDDDDDDGKRVVALNAIRRCGIEPRPMMRPLELVVTLLDEWCTNNDDDDDACLLSYK